MSANDAISGSESNGDEEPMVEPGTEGVKKPVHPSYAKMLVEAIREQQTSWQTGISKAKIVEYIKTTYKLEEVNANALKKAVAAAEEGEVIEHKTGTGMSGSYIFTKKERALHTKKQSKSDLKLSKSDLKLSKSDLKLSKSDLKQTASAKDEPKPKPKVAKGDAKPVKKSKDDMELKDAKKDTKKKPAVPKGKENKEKEKPKTAAKKPVLTKSRSNSAVADKDAGPSTSKRDTQKQKMPAAKRAKQVQMK